MLSTEPLFSLYWQGHEVSCACGELAVCRADGTHERSGESRVRSPARSLLEPFEVGASPGGSAALAALLGAQLGRDGPVEMLTDAGGSPAPLLELGEVAALYRALGTAAEDTPLGGVRRVWLARPDWFGAPDGVDSRLMRANPGRLVAKLGLDGLLAIGVVPVAGPPAATGIAIRLPSGDQPEWAALAARPFLEALGLAPLPEPTRGHEVRWHVRPSRMRPSPLDISPTLSERLAVWPGDTPFRRATSVEPGPRDPGSAEPAWQLVVSSVHTTLHVGAHVDAPNHVGTGGVGIDRVPLQPYRGLCEVIRVHVPKGSTIAPRDLGGRPPRAPRVLLATGSYPDPERFDPDFSALSPELVAWLEAHGAVLVGIDTPSVDPLASSHLPSHRATRHGRGLAILEGLVLDGVTPGLYELVALPLRIEGADGSPVRATLWPLR
jgi:arylformamidase